MVEQQYVVHVVSSFVGSSASARCVFELCDQNTHGVDAGVLAVLDGRVRVVSLVRLRGLQYSCESSGSTRSAISPGVSWTET
jgi:hypothetical protein